MNLKSIKLTPIFWIILGLGGVLLMYHISGRKERFVTLNGTWKDSCSLESNINNTLTAKCKNSKGNYTKNSSVLNYGSCPDYKVKNQGGKLQCG